MSEQLLAEARSRLEELLAPISGGVGEDPSYDEKYDQLKTEGDKLSSLSGEQVNWGNIAALGRELLTDKAKDFRVACYLAAALVITDGPRGLLDSLVLLDGFVKAFWEACYPPLRRLRARAGMLGWYSDQAGPVAMDFKLTAKDGALVAAIEGLSTSVDADLRARFGDQFPGMSKIRDACRHLARTVPKEAAPPPPKPAPSSAAAPPQAPPPVGPPGAAAPVPPPPLVVAADGPAVNPRAITDATAAKRAVSGLGQLLMRRGGAMRAGRPEDPDAYRFSRWGMWLEVVQAPPVTDGKSLVPPPPAGLRQRFDGLAAAEDWLTLLNEADNAAAQHILWLDPHRHVATAMDRLGALFLKAKKALLTEVALLLLRVPTLPQLAFSNGEPFAGGPTRMWLDAEVKPALGGGPGGPERGGGGGPSVLDEPLQKAQGLVVAGKLAEAVELVGRAAAAAPIPAERFRGKLALAQLCLRAGKFDVARAQLHGLCAQIEEHRLVDWEPGLCAEVYAALFAAHKGANVGPQIPADLLADQQAAFRRLCQLDPAAALRLAAEGKGG